MWKPFFLIMSRLYKILWQRSNNQQKSLYVGYFYAEVNQEVHSFSYEKCVSRNTVHSYVQFQKKFIIMQKGDHNTALNF